MRVHDRWVRQNPKPRTDRRIAWPRLAILLALVGCDDGPLGTICLQYGCVRGGVAITLTSEHDLPLGTYSFELTTETGQHEWVCVIDAEGRCPVLEIENDVSETLYEFVQLTPRLDDLNALEVWMIVVDDSEHGSVRGPESVQLRVWRDATQVLDRTATPVYQVREQPGAPECGRCEEATVTFALDDPAARDGG